MLFNNYFGQRKKNSKRHCKKTKERISKERQRKEREEKGKGKNKEKQVKETKKMEEMGKKLTAKTEKKLYRKRKIKRK